MLSYDPSLVVENPKLVLQGTLIVLEGDSLIIKAITSRGAIAYHQKLCQNVSVTN